MAQARAGQITEEQQQPKKRKATVEPEPAPEPVPRTRRSKPRPETASVDDPFDLEEALKEMQKFAERYKNIQKLLEGANKELETEKKREKALHDMKKALEASTTTITSVANSHSFVSDRWGNKTSAFLKETADEITKALKTNEEVFQSFRKRHEKLAPIAKRLDEEIPVALKDFPIGICSICLDTVLVRHSHVILPCSHLLCWRDYAALPSVEKVQPDGAYELVRSCPNCRAVIPRVEAVRRIRNELVRDRRSVPSYSPIDPDYIPTFPSSPVYNLVDPDYVPRSPSGDRRNTTTI